MPKILKLNDPNTIATLNAVFKDVRRDYPAMFDFLDQFCGVSFPIMSSDPQEICYSSGKRDVALTINTISRDDIDPKDIAAFFNEKE